MENIYDAPQANINEIEVDSHQDIEFYIVSLKKFTILFMSTFGIYAIYWFYRNWRLQKNRTQDDIWPVARGIFNIFYAYPLFECVKSSLEDRSLAYKWNPSRCAVSYVFIVIAGRIVAELPRLDSVAPYVHVTAVASLSTLPISCYILSRAQGAINFSQNDIHGVSNSKLTLANVLWCALGLLGWLLFLAGLSVILS